ncbi:MAG: WD40/YVTN/BNR-like repeat-containing protein [Saprospiraceae bacterium]
MRFFLYVASLCLILCNLQIPTTAQNPTKVPNATVNPDLFSGMQYRNVGPTRGGRATVVAGIPSQMFTFLMGSTGGGVWKTDDAGNTWKNISDGQIEAGSIGAIAVAPSDESTIYVGTGSACPRGNISQGVGMYKSIDGGKKWQHIGLPKAGLIGKIEVHPSNPDLVYVAVLGQIFGPNKERGVYRSKDGGKNWEAVLQVSDTTGAIDLSMNPKNPREIYAAMWRAERKPWTMIDGGKDGGIWKTMDGGDTWTKLTEGLPKGLIGRIGVAVSPANPNRVWALVCAAEEEEAGLYRSDDAGQTWNRICRDHKLRQRGWYYSHVTADPKNDNIVYVNNVDFWKSVDGGKSFDIEISVPHGDNHGLWINPNNTDVMIHCNDGGATVTLNGGKSWSTELNQPTSEFYRVTVDNQFPYRLYAGQQDNTTISVPSHEIWGVTDTEHWHEVGGGECADVAVHPQDPNIVWAGSYSGEITITNFATGEQRQVTPYPHYTEGTEQRKLKYRFQWNAPLLISKFNPNTVYYASNFVHKTTNNGQSWELVSPDLTRKLDKYFDIPGGPIQHDATGVEVYCTVFALEESPFKEGELWAGTDDGLLHISHDGGKTWQNITPKGIPGECTINKIELSTHHPGRAFVAIHNYRNHDFKPYLLCTNDFGKTWELLTDGKNGIPDGHFIRAIAEDPDRKGLLYAGTEYGMYISFNDGKNWQPFQLNLPVVPITDMEVHEKDLAISTQGRAFWVLDDLTPLHQLNDNLAKADKILYKPRDTYRTNVNGYNAAIHFYLAEEPKKDATIQLDILDANGKVIRSFTKDAKNRRNKMEAKKGFNTLSWDLLHEGPELVDDFMSMDVRYPAPGARAVPGKYQVKLQIGDWSQTQAFELKKDPRWTDVTDADYQAQLAMVTEIGEMITDAHKRIKNLRAVRDQLKNTAQLAEKVNKNTQLKKLSEDLDKKLTGVEDLLIQNKVEVSQDEINYERVFSNHLTRLYGVVRGEHARPTGGATERLEDLKKEYDAIIIQYEQVMEMALKEFNTLLEKEKVSRIVVPERVGKK